MLLAKKKSTFLYKASFSPKLCTQFVNVSLVTALSEFSDPTSFGKNKASFSIEVKLSPAHPMFVELLSGKLARGQE